MPETPQTKSNHARFDPPFHFFIVPCLGFLLIAAIVRLVQYPSLMNGEFALLIFVVVVLALKSRMYSLKVQDRVIRLEERLRLAALANAPSQDWIYTLSESQLIALRFASDTEAPGLARRALHEKMPAKQIKQAIENWRPDYWRV